MEYRFTPPPRKLKAFTLAEVLITLVIIGVVAAITVPSILSTTQEKEFHTALRKNLSVIQNAFYRAQVDAGLMGYNSAVIDATHADGGRVSLANIVSSEMIISGLSQYINTSDYCTYYASRSIKQCENSVYEELETRFSGGLVPTGYMWLMDGSIYGFFGSFGYSLLLSVDVGYTDDEEYIYIDVNGDKKPNKWGKDLYLVRVTEKKFEVFDNPNLEPSENMNKIILNKK